MGAQCAIQESFTNITEGHALKLSNNKPGDTKRHTGKRFVFVLVFLTLAHFSWSFYL